MQAGKIAHLVRWLEIGGTEQVILNLCSLGSGRQWVVACADGPMRQEFERLGIEVRLAARPEHLGTLLGDADLVNIHWNVNWKEHAASWYHALLRTLRPMVFTLHCLTPLPRLPGWVICTSRTAFDRQLANAERRWLIPNGVDTERFHPRPHGGPGSRVRIIRVCRPIRCAEYFWPALCQVLERCPEAELRIVGGPEYSFGRVQSVGYQHAVADQLQAADIFAYTPLPHEGTLDLVVLEAMAAGLACVVADVPCVRASIEHGRTGWLTPFGDVAAFADAIIRLVLDPGLRSRLGQQAAAAARTHFDFRTRIPLYEQAYERALAEAGSRPPEGLGGSGLIPTHSTCRSMAEKCS